MTKLDNVVVVGGGTGSFMLLNELKNHARNLTAIVNMADDGGSTGVLRDELGVLPPGDVRQCLVALSETPKLRELFSYRFEEGTFAGHSFGNILLTALEKSTGSFAEAVETASEILRIDGAVLPATLDNVRLAMRWPDGTVLRGEHVIDAEHFAQNPRHATLTLDPQAKANPHAIAAIQAADVIIIAPGDLYTSIGPLLAVEGIVEAIIAASAKKYYITNLVTKEGQTDGLTVDGHAHEIERLAGSQFLDVVIYNDAVPDKSLKEAYKAEGSYAVEVDQHEAATRQYEIVGGAFLGQIEQKNSNDILPLTRSLIRHDAAALVAKIIEIVDNTK